MSLRFIRSIHYKREPIYDGWWTQILKTATAPVKIQIEQVPTRVPIAIPFVEEQPEPTMVPTPKTTVYLNNTAIELPQKPDVPDNCCMSGCAHCVWDMYGEDMEEYAAKKSEIRNRFESQGVRLPKELEVGSGDQPEEMDPSMKAFLDMEKRLHSM